jgi:lysophospholipase L1-like esterase
VLSSRKGGFTQYLEIGGTLEQVRYSDGVHLAPAGYDLLAHDLVMPMERAWKVNLRVGS